MKQQLTQNPNQPAAPVARRPRWKTHMLTLVVVNILFLIGIGVLTQQMTKAGEEIKKLRTESLARDSQAAHAVAEQELASAESTYSIIAQAFPNETGVLEFVTSLDALKRQGLISQFSFASDTPLKDKNGILGLPILIELRGSGAQISEGLKALDALPTIMNTVKVEVSTADDGAKLMRYGGFLYVDQNISAN